MDQNDNQFDTRGHCKVENKLDYFEHKKFVLCHWNEVAQLPLIQRHLVQNWKTHLSIGANYR